MTPTVQFDPATLAMRPWHVVATPGLGTDALPPDTPVLFGMTWETRAGSPKLEATWARLDDGAPDPTAIGPTDRIAWLTMIAEHGPSALLMLNGRRHRRMVPPEIEQRIAQLQSQLGLEVRFHPLFEWPEMREDAVRQAEAEALAAFGDHRGFQCDITGETIAPAQAAVLTPWEFRRSPLRARFVAEVGDAAEVLLAANWSDWVVRRDLAAMAAARSGPVADFPNNLSCRRHGSPPRAEAAKAARR